MSKLIPTQLASQEVNTRIFFRIYQCDNLINRTVTNALAQYEITSQQWAILGVLSNAHATGGIAVGELSNLLKVSRQNISGILLRLENRDLIERITDSIDTRTRLVRLTPEGKAIWEKMMPRIAAYFNEIMEGVNFDDSVTFLNLLNQLLFKLEKM
jgi:DNA-binding MarR family transcriptional regulator